MGSGKKKIEIKRIEKESSRMVTFSKRRKGLFKKVRELQAKIGANVAVIVFSPAGNPYTMGDVSLFDNALNKGTGPASGGATFNGFDFEKGGKDANAFCASTSNGLREWLDGIDVDGCAEIEELLHMKEQLLVARERIQGLIR